MRLSLPILCLSASLTGLVGCAGINKTMDKGTGALGELLLPLSEEVQLGKQIAADVNKQEKILNDQEVQAYVRSVGKRIADASGDKRKGIQYTFTVIDQPDVINAFALPGGHIYVYSGLILAARTEAELASVLGHEVGHVTGRHAAQSLGTAYGLEALSAVALGEKPGTITQIAAGIAAQGYMSRHSRDAEREADSLGLQYLIKAGYDPHAMPRFFQELVRVGGTSNALEQFFASHPDASERSKNLERMIKQRKAGAGAKSLVGDFEKLKTRIRGGAAPAQGAAAPTKQQAGSSSAPAPGPAPAPAPAGR